MGRMVSNYENNAVYAHGHAASVLASHGARTAATSAAYLLPLLRPGMRLLDVGCGPGSVTLDLAQVVDGVTGAGQVVGLENVEAPLEAARALAAARGDERTRWELGDVYALPFDDDSFDVVHAHQVLQHLADPVAALAEMARVARPGGLVAARDADYEAMTWHPRSAGMTDWLDTYRRLARANGAEPDAGRRLLEWAHAAGLTEVSASASTWCYADYAGREYWAGTWSRRVTDSDFADGCRRHGLADDEQLARMAQAWREWPGPDSWFVVVHGEILARP